MARSSLASPDSSVTPEGHTLSECVADAGLETQAEEGEEGGVNMCRWRDGLSVGSLNPPVSREAPASVVLLGS